MSIAKYFDSEYLVEEKIYNESYGMVKYILRLIHAQGGSEAERHISNYMQKSVPAMLNNHTAISRISQC